MAWGEMADLNGTTAVQSSRLGPLSRETQTERLLVGERQRCCSQQGSGPPPPPPPPWKVPPGRSMQYQGCRVSKQYRK